jgi:DNA-binding SARP family transcriptional activator
MDIDRIQVCGPLIVLLDGRRRESDLPGRQGRMLVGYLVVHRARPVTRDELAAAVWPDETPESAPDALSALLSRVRRALGAERVVGRSDLRLALPAGTVVDIETAQRSIQWAESAVAQERWRDAWGSARAALHAANRGFLPGYEAPWVEEQSRHLEGIRLRALDAIATVGLALGGTELPAVGRCARALIEAAPFRETGYRHLMRFHAAHDDVAEALQTYERLRILLREELGVGPSEAAKALHSELLGAD